MFTVKQSGPEFEKMWPRVSCVDVRKGARGDIEAVTALFADGGLFDFTRGEREQTIYVMNDNGSTVGRYLLRGGLSAPGGPNTDQPIEQLAA